MISYDNDEDYCEDDDDDKYVTKWVYAFVLVMNTWMRMRWVERVAYMKDMRNDCKILADKSRRKKLLGRPRRRQILKSI